MIFSFGLCISCCLGTEDCSTVNDAFQARPIVFEVDGQWIGNAISYGPYREGQRPGGGRPHTKEQMREDLRLISKYWRVLRMYTTNDSRREMFEVRFARRSFR